MGAPGQGSKPDRALNDGGTTVSTLGKTNTRKTKPELSADKKAAFRLLREKLRRLLTLETLLALPLPGELSVEEPMRCLWHNDEHPSMTGWTCKGGYPLWTCHGPCQHTYDAVDVVGLAYKLEGKAARRKALELVGGRAALAGVKLSLDDLALDTEAAAGGEPRWPPRDEVRAVLAHPRPAAAAHWFSERGLSLDFARDHGLAYSTSGMGDYWAGGKSGWDRLGYGLSFATVSPDGERACVRARRTGAHRKTGEVGTAKAKAPLGHNCDGTVLVNPEAWRFFASRLTTEADLDLATTLLRAYHQDPNLVVEVKPLPTELEIAEGEGDFLRRCESAGPGVAVVGLFAGAWSQAHADKIPAGTKVKSYCHSDEAGIGYQHRVADTLRGRCPIRVRHQRVRLVRRVADGRCAYRMGKLPDEVELYKDLGRVGYAGSEGDLLPYLDRNGAAAAEPSIEAEPAVADLPFFAVVEPAAEAEPVAGAAQVAAPAASNTSATAPAAAKPDPRPVGRPSAADRLLEILDQKGIRPRPDGAGVPCAWVPVDGAGGLPHPIPLRSPQFARLLRRWLDEAKGGTASPQTIKRVVETLEARIEVDPLASDDTDTPELWMSDADNATRLERHVEGKAIHTPVSGWLTLSGGIWERDAKAIVRLAEGAMRKIPDEAEGLPEPQALAIQRWGLRSLSESSIKSAISLASARESLSVKEDDLDKDDLLIGTLSGVLDLRTERVVADPAKHLVTRRAPVAWDPTARAPKWEWFLRDIFEGDQSKIDFLQRLIGYCLTGCVDEPFAVVFHGPRARNGKSTVLDVVLELLGQQYAHKANHPLLSSLRARGEHGTDRDQQRGRRLTLIDEWPRGAGFDEAKFKSATGGKVLSGRDIGKSESNYRATAKHIVASNYLIEVSGDDDAVWARLLVLLFPVSYLGRENRGLYMELIQELPGIFAWAVRGTREWMRLVRKPGSEDLVRRGLDAPPSVLDYTAKCREQMDDLGRWASERLLFDEGATSTPTELAASWANWAEEAKIPAGAANRLTSRTAVGVVCARWGLADKPGRSCSRMVVGVRVIPAIAPAMAQRQSGIPTPADLDQLLGNN